MKGEIGAVDNACPHMGGPLNEFTFIDDPLHGFNKQHDVRRIENGNITLFDNGTQHEPMLSRAVEYEIDELNKTATLIWAYNHPDNIVAVSMGSVQRLPNQNTLINWGFFFETNIFTIFNKNFNKGSSSNPFATTII